MYNRLRLLFYEGLYGLLEHLKLRCFESSYKLKRKTTEISSMKKIIALIVLLSLATLVAVIEFMVISIDSSTISFLEYRNGKQKASVDLALKLQSAPGWFIVDDNNVSSLPDGKGEVVNVGDVSLKSLEDHLGIKHPEYNKRVRFFQSVSVSQLTVAGKLLGYEYLD